MTRERKKPGEAQIEEGGEGGLPEFPFQFSLEKEERGKERGFGGRGSAGVAPPDLDRDTKSTPPSQVLLFLPCLL